MDRMNGRGESSPSPEGINHNIEQLLLSCERIGEGGKAVVLKLSLDQTPGEFNSALEALNVLPVEAHSEKSPSLSKALKLFKLYLPNKGAFEYKMHRQAYEATSTIQENERDSFAKVPALSSTREIVLEEDIKNELESKFRVSIVGDKAQLIVMEYVDGEDLATIFYKWILEKERRFTAEETDAMDFTVLYQEVAKALHFESLPEAEVRDPRALELAEWKNTSNNTNRLYDYLRKHKFPLSPEIVTQVENTLNLLHRSHIIHGDAFERNIMVEGGIKAIRSNTTQERKQSYLIDFGEAKDHDMEGVVDDFAVIRRLKQLLISPEQAAKLKIQEDFAAIDDKAKSLKEQNKRWQETYGKVRATALTNPEKALNLAWNYTVELGENFIEDFFVMAKELMNDGLCKKDAIAGFVGQKEKATYSPFKKRRIKECAEWLGA